MTGVGDAILRNLAGRDADRRRATTVGEVVGLDVGITTPAIPKEVVKVKKEPLNGVGETDG